MEREDDSLTSKQPLGSRQIGSKTVGGSKNTSTGLSMPIAEDAAAPEGDNIIDVPLTKSARIRRAMEIELDAPITPYDTSVLVGQRPSTDEPAPQTVNQFDQIYPVQGSSFLGPNSPGYTAGNIPSDSPASPAAPWSPAHFASRFDLERRRIEADLNNALPEVVDFLDPWESNESPRDFELPLPESQWSDRPRLSVDAWYSPRSTVSGSSIRNITQARINHPAIVDTQYTDTYGVFGSVQEEEQTYQNLTQSSQWGFRYITASPAGSVRSSPRRSATNISNVMSLPFIATPQQTILYSSPSSTPYPRNVGSTFDSSPMPFMYQSTPNHVVPPTAGSSPRPFINLAMPSEEQTVFLGQLSNTPMNLANLDEEGLVPQQNSFERRPTGMSNTHIRWENYNKRSNTKRVTNIANISPQPTVEVSGQYPQPISTAVGYDLSVAKDPGTSSFYTPAPSVITKSSWELYNEKARHEDRDFIRSINESMDPLLVFAGLFSAVLAGFLQFTLPLLQPNRQEATTILLSNILTKLNNSTQPMLVQEERFKPSVYAIRVNCLLFASIASALVAGLGAILIKQWTRQYELGLDGISSHQLRARTRQFRMSGVSKWHLRDIAAFIPITVHLSLFCFFVGMVEYLYPLCKPVALVVLAFLVITGALYIIFSTIPIASSRAPFRSPLTSVIEKVVSWIRPCVPGIRSSKQGRKDKARSNSLPYRDDKSQDHRSGPDPKFDIDVLASLIKAADYRTEPWILDQCIDNLRVLKLQPTIRTRLLKRQEILEAYRQLTASCMRRRVLDGADVLDPNQEARARALCEFAVWMTQDESNQAELNRLAQYLPQSGDELPRLLLRHGLKVSGNGDTVIAAHLALSARNHIHTTSCWDCFQRESQVYDHLLSLSEQKSSLNDTQLRSTRLMAIRFINNQTRCLLHFAAVYPTETYTKGICKLVQRLQLYHATTIDAWDPIHLDRDHVLPPPRRATRDDKWVARRDHWLESLRKSLGVVSPQAVEPLKENPSSKFSWRNRQTTV